jgi:hypothetical protein
VLLEEADAAFARGDYAAAVGLYEQAEPRAADPGRVTLGLAAAKYRLASAGPGAAATVVEAEALYRCCVGPGNPRRAEALLGLGNCLLRRAGDRDVAAAREALDCFEQCPADPHAGPELAADARHNRERARLLVVQAEAAAKSRPDAPPNPDQDTPPRPPDRPPPPGGEAEPDLQGGRQKPGTAAAKADQGQPAQETGDTAPGQGNLPPVPDDAAAPPLSARDAREHLEQATRRIVEDGQKHRRGAARPAPAGVRDW